jgi:hypothetical protein
MSLFFQNQPKGARPQRVDDLLGNELMARIGRLDLVSRKIFSGKLQGERRSKPTCTATTCGSSTGTSSVASTASS